MFHISNADEGKSEWNINETHIIIPMIEGDINKESDKILTSSLTLNPLEAGDQAMLSNALEHSFVIGLDKNLFESPNYKSDLVIIQNSNLKNPVAYALSYVDQDKSEILWQAPAQKDKIYTNDKAILQVKDELDYQMGKTEQINLVIDTEIEPQVSKSIHKEIINEDKNDKSQFINYLTEPQNTIQYVDSSKERSVGKEFFSTTQNKLDENLFAEPTTECNESEFLKHKTEELRTKDDMEKTFKRVSESLPEKSLPLKKKAKMKRTVMCSENQRSLLKQDVTANQQCVTGRKAKQVVTDEGCSDARRRKSQLESSVKKSKKCISVMENTTEKFQQEESSNNGFDSCKFSSIYDLVDCLRKCRMINASIWQTLNSGLKEMNVDILQEINAKKGSLDCSNYSPQLKAFALVLYFKQPAAFNYLSRVYEAGWPSLKIIKDWKRRINSHQRPPFVCERGSQALK